MLGDAGADLARLLPELRSRVPYMAERPAADPETERGRLFTAVATVVSRLAKRYPVVCIIDDLHWADRSSLLLGKHMARAPELGRVLLLGTYRDTELDDRHPLVEALADLERDGPIQRIALGGLGDQEVTALAAAHGQELDADTVRGLRDETQGNPFFVNQLLRHLEEEGGEGFAASAGLRDVVVRRVGRLPGAADQVLRVAALIGRDFSLEVLESVAGVPEDDVLDALDGAVRGGILVEVESTPGQYSFVHALLRTTLEQDLTATRRARLHLRIGEAIEELYAERLDDHLDDLARHFGAAGPREAPRAIAYAERAAEQAVARLAYEEAVRLLDGALAAAGVADWAQRARLLNSLARALGMAGRHNEARRTHAEAAEAARAAVAPELLARAALGHAGGAFERYGTADPESAALLREALDGLDERDSRLRVQLLARLSGVLYWSDEAPDEFAGRAVDMARRLEDDQALMAALLAAQWAYWRPNRSAERLALADDLLEVTERSRDLESLATAHSWRQGPLLELCRREEAEAANAAYVELAERLQQPELLVQAAAYRSTFALLDGRWDDVELARGDVLELGERYTALVGALYGSQSMALLSHRLQLGGLLEQFEFLRGRAEALPGWRAVIAWAQAQAGEKDLARTEAHDLQRDDFGALPRDANFEAALAILSHVAAELGDAALAADVEPHLRPVADRWVVMGVGGSEVGPAAYSLGQVTLTQGRAEAAAADFERSLGRSRVMRSRPWEAHSLLGLSKALESSDPQRAGELRDQAVAIAHELGGMQRLLRDAQARQ